jgi:hypothetical protein
MPNQPPTVEDVMDSLEQAVVDRLSGDPWFAQARLKGDGTWVTIPVIKEDLGVVSTEIQKVIFQGDPGIAIIVQALEWDVQYLNAPGPYIEKLDLVLLGIENVVFNRGSDGADSPNGSLRTIKATMVRAQELIHLWTPPGFTRALVATRASLVKVGSAEDGDAGILQYNVPVRAAGGVGVVPPRVATPTIASASGTVTLACSTPGAAVCYSWDGSLPTPAPGGQVYAGPFPAQTGKLLRTNAWLSYWLTSAVATQQF